MMAKFGTLIGAGVALIALSGCGSSDNRNASAPALPDSPELLCDRINAYGGMPSDEPCLDTVKSRVYKSFSSYCLDMPDNGDVRDYSNCQAVNRVAESRNDMCLPIFLRLESIVKAISKAQLSVDENSTEIKNELMPQKLADIGALFNAVGVGNYSGRLETNPYGGLYIETTSPSATQQKQRLLDICKSELDKTQIDQLDFFID